MLLISFADITTWSLSLIMCGVVVGADAGEKQMKVTGVHVDGFFFFSVRSAP
jgi:hypothetical protein